MAKPATEAEFDDAAVAQAYAYRPPYAADALQCLLAISPRHNRLVDLGCGSGKVINALAPHFLSCTGVDLSQPMLDVAASNAPQHSDIGWECAAAEVAALGEQPIDLVTAGASIHWMNHAQLFPRLRSALAPDGWFATIDGDGPDQPPWEADWQDFLARWIPRLTGQSYQPNQSNSSFNQRMNRHLAWLDVHGHQDHLSEWVVQSIDDFIRCQHSRATFTLAQLGDQAANFNAELRALLDPYSRDDCVRYRVRSTVTWGRPLATPKKEI